MFAGYGGLDLGLMQVFPEARPAWHMEIEPGPAHVLAHHYPTVPNLGDVTKVDWEHVEPVDIITAGYPCQPFSVAGHRKGTNDKRHLWPHVLNAIRILRPQFAVFENVPGHITCGLDTVLADLAGIGWDAQWQTIRASDVGAPHHRERLFILAYPNGKRPQAQRQSGGQAQEIPWDNDLLDTLAGISGAANISHEIKMRWGQAAPRILTWAMVTGHLPPIITEEINAPSIHPRFPSVKAQTSAEMIEWLMGLPAGWVTETPNVTRAQQLKMLGNGVVPLQAATAIEELVEVACGESIHAAA